MSLNLLLKDKQGKKIELDRLACYTGVSPQFLLDCFYGRKGYGLNKAIILSIICKEKGYDFPPETFLNRKVINNLNVLLSKYNIKIESYNPLKQ